MVGCRNLTGCPDTVWLVIAGFLAGAQLCCTAYISQRTYFGVRVSQNGKPLIPNHKGIIPNQFGIVPIILVLYHKCWYCTKQIVLYKEFWYYTTNFGIIPKIVVLYQKYWYCTKTVWYYTKTVFRRLHPSFSGSREHT